MDIVYNFEMPDGSRESFSVELNRKPVSPIPAPEWTKLDYHKCDNCPLAKEASPLCPAAADIANMTERFSAVQSFDKVKVHVQTPERDYFKKCDAQTGLISLMGLVLATSACPILSEFKVLAIHHLPFASYEETLFRTSGAYLLKQYLKQKNGEEADMEMMGLKQFYEDLGVVNKSLKNRISVVSQSDSNINAVNALFSLSWLVAQSLEERLDELQEHLGL